jgi:DNA-binding SARP family transcriptional activator
MFSVHMLGVLKISVDGRRIADDLGPNGRSLSGFLFHFIGRIHRRERLADQFWGHLDPERARAALNTALWRFRKLLANDPLSESAQNFHTTTSDVVLEPAPWLEIDTIDFVATVKRLLDEPEFVDASELEKAVEFYGGPFLDGEDSDWILQERENLHSLYVRAAVELLRHYGRLERYEEAVAAARRVLATDPFREAIHRDLLVLLLLNGQPGEALRQQARWRAMLQEELGICPMPQTIRLVEDIRSGKIFDRLEMLRTQYFLQPKNHVLPNVAPLAPPLAVPAARAAPVAPAQKRGVAAVVATRR